jgi:hypothetical protein
MLYFIFTSCLRKSFASMSSCFMMDSASIEQTPGELSQVYTLLHLLIVRVAITKSFTI